MNLTLVDEHGKELDMGTEFDYFGPEAETFYFEKSKTRQQVHKNRMLLYEAFIAEGFTNHVAEWWHFNYGNQKWAEASNKQEVLYAEISEVPD